MAQKRVDTKFVVILASVMALVVVSVVGVVYWVKRAENAPDKLLRRADEELAKGNISAGINFVYRAAQNSRTGAEKVWERYGDLCFENSKGHVELYLAAIDGWGYAVNANHGYLPPNEKRLRELYVSVREMIRPPLLAPSVPLPGNLSPLDRIKTLRGAAQDMLGANPNSALAYACRGYGTIIPCIRVPDLKRDAEYAKARADLDKAMALDPDNFAAFCFLAEFDMQRARYLVRENRSTDARVLQDEALRLLQGFMEKHPKDPDAAAEWGTRCIQLARTEDAVKRLTPIYEAVPPDRRLSDVMATCQLQEQKFKEGEEILKKCAEANPTDMLAMFRLAQHFEQFQRWPDAVACWQTLHSPKPANLGPGIQSYAAAYLMALGRQELPRMLLQLVRVEDANLPATKTHLEQARSLIEVLRGLSPNDPYVALLMGRLLHLQGQTMVAIDRLKQADAIVSAEQAKRGPAGVRNFVLSKTYLAEAYLAANDLGPAMKCYEDILHDFPNDVRAKVERDKIWLTLGRGPEVAQDMREMVAKYPNYQEAKQLLIQALAQQGKTDEIDTQIIGMEGEFAKAVRAYLAEDWQGVVDVTGPMLEKNPNNERAAHLAATAYMRMNNHKDDARRLLEDLVKRFPNKLQYRYSLDVLENPQKSRDELVQGVIDAIQDPFTQQMMWASYYRGKRNVNKEIEALQAAEKLKPDAPELIEEIFTALLYKGDFTAAGSYASKAAATNQDGVQGKLFQGRLEMARKETVKGLRTLQDAVSTWPEHAVARQILGYAYQELGQTDRAIEQLAKAIEIRPNNVPAMRAIIGLLRTKGDEESIRLAQQYLAQGLRVARDDKGLREFDDLIGDLDAAMARREAIYKTSPDNDENTESLARLYIRQGNLLSRDPAKHKEGQAAIEKAVNLLLPIYDKRRDDLRFADAIARLYRALGKPNDAFAMYQRFLMSQDPKVRDDAKIDMARMYRSLNQMPEAVRLFEEVAASPTGSPTALHELAVMYFDLDELSKAETVYRKLRETEGDSDPAIVRQLVLIKIRQNQFADAQKLLSEAILDKHPDDPEGLVLSGYLLLNQGDPTKASAQFAKVLAKNPRNTDALYYRALSQFTLLGDLRQATQDLVSVKEILPTRPDCRRLLGRIYRLQRQYGAAVVEYRQCLGLVPDAVSVRLELVDYLVSLVEALRHLPAEARDGYTMDLRSAKPAETLQGLLADSMRLYPSQPVWAARYAEALAGDGQNAEALAVLKKAVADFPDSAAISSAYLAFLAKSKKYDEAIALADHLIADSPNRADVYGSRAIAYFGKGKRTEAAADIDQSLARQRDYNNGMAGAQQLARETDADFVAGVIETRIQKQPTEVSTRMALASIRMGQGRFPAVVAALEPALADAVLTNPENKSARALVLRTLGDAAYSADNPSAAIKYYTEVLAIQPDDLEALNNSAYLLAESKQPKEALVRARKALDVLRQRAVETVYTTHGNVMDTYGWILFQNGDYKEARVILERVCQTDPLPMTLYHLARTLEQLKDFAAARQTIADAIEMAKARADKATLQLALAFQESLDKRK